MMLRLLVLACCLLAVTAANDNSQLLNLLKKLLDETDKRLSTGACTNTGNNVEDQCNGGMCNDSEDPWGLGFYCVHCPTGYGGYTCDVDDPCTTNPCPGASDYCYGPVSMDPLGRFCYATRNAELVDRLQRKLDDGEMVPSDLEGLLRHMKSADFDDSLSALKRVLE